MKSWLFIGTLVSVGALAAACSTKAVTNPNLGTGGDDNTTAGNGNGNTVATGTGTTTTVTGSTVTGTTSTGLAATTGSNTTGSGGGGTGTCDSPNTTADCAACADNTSCAGDTMSAGCCGTASMTGLNNANNFIIKDCACAAGSTCNAACSGAGDVCPGLQNQPSNGCITCLNGLMNTDACLTAFKTDCQGDADCTDYVTCLNACPPAM